VGASGQWIELSQGGLGQWSAILDGGQDTREGQPITGDGGIREIPRPSADVARGCGAGRHD
jgi:hypothetical protein